jgi:hypothetical protein
MNKIGLHWSKSPAAFPFRYNIMKFIDRVSDWVVIITKHIVFGPHEDERTIEVVHIMSVVRIITAEQLAVKSNEFYSVEL